MVEPSIVKLATKDRAPTSIQMAEQIVQGANLDTAVLYIEVRCLEPTPDSRGMKADGGIVALDVTMVDPKTGAILWEVHRPSRPVPLYGVVLTGQANLFVAETVMQVPSSGQGNRTVERTQFKLPLTVLCEFPQIHRDFAELFEVGFEIFDDCGPLYFSKSAHCRQNRHANLC